MATNNASYVSDGEWVPQRDVTMRPIEEAMITASIAVETQLNLLPHKLAQNEEFELLLSQGTLAVTVAKTTWQTAYNTASTAINAANAACTAAALLWSKRIAYCLANGLDADTYQGTVPP